MLDPLPLLQKFDLHPAKNTGCHSYLPAEFQMNSGGLFYAIHHPVKEWYSGKK